MCLVQVDLQNAPREVDATLYIEMYIGAKSEESLDWLLNIVECQTRGTACAAPSMRAQGPLDFPPNIVAFNPNLSQALMIYALISKEDSWVLEMSKSKYPCGCQP